MQAFNENEGVVIGTFDAAGNFLWAVEPSTQTPRIRGIVARYCTNRNAREMAPDTPSHRPTTPLAG